METLFQDTRYALRRLRMAPAFTIANGADACAWDRRHHLHLYFGSRGLAEIAAVANPSALVRLGKEARCCFWSAYDQETSILWPPTICTNISGTIPRASRSFRRSRRTLTSWASVGAAAVSRPKAIPANTFQEITLRPSHSCVRGPCIDGSGRPGWCAGGCSDELTGCGSRGSDWIRR